MAPVGDDGRRVSMLFVSEGTLPSPTNPDLDRWAMAATLVRHARGHFAYFQEHTDGVSMLPDPAVKNGVQVHIRKAKPLPAGDELLLELEVKHAVEDLRSALEYLSMEIFERICCHSAEPQPHEHRQVTFPIPPADLNTEEFSERIEAIFPGLGDANPSVFETLLSARLYVTGESVWLDTLQAAWNEVKHRRLASSQKPMKIHVAGFDSDSIPAVNLLYFPDTTRAVSPNLSAAIEGVAHLLAQAEKALKPAA